MSLISVIVPTHNRVDSLQRTLDSVFAMKGEADFEVVVVANNCTDKTEALVAEYAVREPSRLRCVSEHRTAFSKARNTGAENANGDILLYIDDDVLLKRGSFRKLVKIFNERQDAGVVAGKISPNYLETPPVWTLRCQEKFNGWSLFYPWESGGDLQVVDWAAGPMMAIRRSIYFDVGGFPADTIGVETNTKKNTFRKLYVGPGDCGLCHRIQQKGYKVYFSTDVACEHVIPPIRFTRAFWRSRMIGEGHYIAVANREFYRLPPVALLLERIRHQALYLFSIYKLANKNPVAPRGFPARLVSRRLLRNIFHAAGLTIGIIRNYLPFGTRAHALQSKFIEILDQLTGKSFDGVYPEELIALFARSYLEGEYLFRGHPGLTAFLWKIGTEGVDDSDFEAVLGELPTDYRRRFVDDSSVYDDRVLRVEQAATTLSVTPQVARELDSVRKVIAVLRPYCQTEGTLEDLLCDPGKRSELIDLCNAVIIDHVNEIDLLLLLGALELNVGMTAKAMERFESVLAADPGNAYAIDLLKTLGTRHSISV